MSVYFAQAGAYVKIGYSADPLARIGTVTIAGKRPADLPRGADAELIGWIPGDRLQEGGLHCRFAVDHVAGEWFYLDAAMMRDLVWSDPHGIDIHRMSAWAVLAADADPTLTRDDIAAMGIPIEAASEPAALTRFFGGVA